MKIFISLLFTLSIINASWAQTLLPYRAESKLWGFKDAATGKIVIEPKYDNITDFKDGLAYARYNSPYIQIDKKGNRPFGGKYDDISPTSEGLRRVEKDKKYGFINRRGKIIIPIKYTFASSFYGGLAFVAENGKTGAINRKGKLIIPLKYSNIGDFTGILAPTKLYEKYTYIDKKGNMRTPIIYQIAHSFYGERALVKRDNKYGFIDSKGHEIIPPMYEDAKHFYGKFAFVKSGGKYGLIDSMGNTFRPFVYEEVEEFINSTLSRVKKNGKWGFLNIFTGEEKIPFLYDTTGRFYNGLAAVKLQNKWGFIDGFGNLIIPFKYDSITTFCHGSADIKHNGKWGVMDKSFNEKLPCEYEEVISYWDKCIVARKNGKYGLFDKAGNRILPCEYDLPFKFYPEHSTITKRNGKYGLINKDFKQTLPNIYDNIIIQNNTIIVKKGNKYGVVNEDGQEVLPFEYDGITKDDLTIGIVTKNEKIGFYNFYTQKQLTPIKYEKNLNNSSYSTVISEGKMKILHTIINQKPLILDTLGNDILKMDYDWIDIYGSNIFLVKTKDKYQFFDINGNSANNGVIYDNIIFCDSLLLVQKDNKYGFLDAYNINKILIPIEYDYAQCFNYSELSPVKKNNKWGVIDNENKIIIPFEYDKLECSCTGLQYRGCGEVACFFGCSDGSFTVDGRPGERVWIRLNEGDNQGFDITITGMKPTNPADKCYTSLDVVDDLDPVAPKGCNYGAISDESSSNGNPYPEPDAWNANLHPNKVSSTECPGGVWASNENAVWYTFTNNQVRDLNVEIRNVSCQNAGCSGSAGATVQLGVFKKNVAGAEVCNLQTEATAKGCAVGTGTVSIHIDDLPIGEYIMFIDGNGGSQCQWDFVSDALVPPPPTTNFPSCGINYGYSAACTSVTKNTTLPPGPSVSGVVPVPARPNGEWHRAMDASAPYNTDDLSVGPISLPFNYNLYGTNYNQVYFNLNGNLSFGSSYTTYTPSGFPNNTTAKLVAPFFADCDFEASGSMDYFIGTNYAVFTWRKAGYYNAKFDKTNTFQVIITNGTVVASSSGACGSFAGMPAGVNTRFVYEDMQWTTGDASSGSNGFGGVAATVGLNNNDGIDYFQLGRFDNNTSTYDGAYGTNDGVNYLDNKCVDIKADIGSLDCTTKDFFLIPAPGTGSTTVVAKDYCTDASGWRHYYDINNPTKYLFSLYPNDNYIEGSVTIKVNNTYYPATQTAPSIAGTWLMNRNWEYTVTAGSVNIAKPVKVRFYYDPAEKTAIVNAANAWATANGVGANPFVWVKSNNGVVYNPATLTPTGFPNSFVPTTTDGNTTSNGIAYVEIQGLTGFSGGSGGTAAGGGILPVELTKFQADCSKQNVELTWVTASEKNSDYFEIQYSTDGREFYSIGQVKAAGVSNAPKTYNYTHAHANYGANYYRLKQADINGSFEYSYVTVATCTAGFTVLDIRPNPSDAVFTIDMNTDAKNDVTLYLTDMLGRHLDTRSYTFENEGTNRIILDLTDYPKGMYLVQLKQGYRMLSRKIVKH